jgi:hypothetical protein
VSRTSDNTCGAFWRLNLTFYRVAECTTLSSLFWSSTCRWLLIGLSLVSLSFFSSFHISSLKHCRLVLFVFVFFSTSVCFLLIFNFYLWPFCKSFLSSRFSLSISIYHILCFKIWSLFIWFLITFKFSFWVLIFFIYYFYKNFISFLFHPSIKVYGILFILTWSSFFFCYNYFSFQFNPPIKIYVFFLLICYFCP